MPKVDVSKLWTANYRLVVSIIMEVNPLLADLQIDVKELMILGALDENPHPAGLSESLFIPKPSVTMYVKQLEKNGLVKREIDSSDLRRFKLTLTADGKRTLAKGNALFIARFEQRLAHLTHAQQVEFKALIDQMI
ncbi:MAG TPA: MarR family transcriptional regulator [Kofleriaceae bacterium]